MMYPSILFVESSAWRKVQSFKANIEDTICHLFGISSAVCHDTAYNYFNLFVLHDLEVDIQ